MKEQFEFKGEWESKMVLQEFATLDNVEYRKRHHKLRTEEFILIIEDEHNCNPFPEKEQLNAINYLINNQTAILNSIFDYSLNSIYPTYKEFQSKEEYPECYPELNAIGDLRKLLGINEIIISSLKKEDHSYIVFDFSTCLDHEHGLYIIFHKGRIVENGSIGDLSYEKVESEGGNRNYKQSQLQFGDSPTLHGLHIADPEIGKLKPWQQEFNQNRIGKIIHNDPKLFKKLIEEEVIFGDLELYNHSVFEMCVRKRNFELIEYLAKKGGSFGHSIGFCVGEKFDLRLLKFLIDLGADINKPIYNNQSILFKEIYDLAQLMFHNKTVFERPKERIKDILKLGGDLDNCDGKGTDYFELLKKRYAEHFLIRTNIREIIEELKSGRKAKLENNSNPSQSKLKKVRFIDKWKKLFK